MIRSTLRVWLYCCVPIGFLCAVARYDLWVNGSSSSFETLLVWPGWIVSILLGASPHGGNLGGKWDYFVVAIVGGVLWGSLLFTIVAVGRLLVRRPAA
jgi:hypothetical protein